MPEYDAEGIEIEMDPLFLKAQDLAEAWGKTFLLNRFGAAETTNGEVVGTLLVTAGEVVDLIYSILIQTKDRDEVK